MSYSNSVSTLFRSKLRAAVRADQCDMLTQLRALLFCNISALRAGNLCSAVIETFDASRFRHVAYLCQVNLHANTGDIK